MDNGEKRMNPVAMTIINPQKNIGRAGGPNQRPPALRSCTLPTELWGSADRIITNCDQQNNFQTFTWYSLNLNAFEYPLCLLLTAIVTLKFYSSCFSFPE